MSRNSPRRKQKHPEQDVQRAILQFIHAQYPRAFVFHVPNGGKRTLLEAIALKSIGVVSGVADLCILWAGGRVGFLEVKSAKGSATDNQMAFAAKCEELGIPFAFVRGDADAQRVMKIWGVV